MILPDTVESGSATRPKRPSLGHMDDDAAAQPGDASEDVNQ
jgi:hypothetical protein